MMTAAAIDMLLGKSGKLGEEIHDIDEETFDLFSQSIPSQDLGMLNAKANVLEVTLAGRDFEITQSPGLLQSQREGGTTGAAIWQSAVRFAEWLASPENLLSRCGLLNPDTVVLELGAGISGLLPSLLKDRVRRIVSTDQAYIMTALKENIAANARGANYRSRNKHSKKQEKPSRAADVFSLDWEKDDIANVLRQNDLGSGVDVVFACDCIYNYALIDPFVQTCKDICSLRTSENTSTIPTICVIVHQLRQPEVFEQWISAFHKSFQTWRIPSGLLLESLNDNSGFAVHVGILRSTTAT